MSIDQIFSLKWQPVEIRSALKSKLSSNEIVSFVIAYLDKTVPLRMGPCCYRFDTQDFGVQIVKLELPQQQPDVGENLSLDDYMKVMESLKDASEEVRDEMTRKFSTLLLGARNCFDEHAQQVTEKIGIEILFRTIASAQIYIRDWYFAHAGQMLRSNNAVDPSAYHQLSLRLQNDPWHPASRTRHDLYQTFGAAGVVLKARVPNVFKNAKDAPFFFEGGNVFVVTHPQNPGKKIGLIGRYGFLMALLQLRGNGFFKSDKFQKFLADFGSSMTKQELLVEAEEMDLHGLLNDDLKHLDKNKLKPLQWLQETDKVVTRYAAQKEFLKGIIAEHFGLAGQGSQDVVLIEPLSYHLDTFMLPGPKKSFFVQSFALSLDFLGRIKVYAKRFNLTTEDLRILDRLMQAAKKLHQELGPIVDRVHDQLQACGFTVIPSPGLFQDQEAGYQPHYGANFFNAVTSYSGKDKKYHYMAFGIKIGQNLGNALMDMWGAFLRQYQANIVVHYVGDGNGFEQTTKIWTENKAGVHCLALPTAQKSHIDG